MFRPLSCQGLILGLLQAQLNVELSRLWWSTTLQECLLAVQSAHCVTGTIEAERNCQTGSVLALRIRALAACDGDLKKESNGHQNATFALGGWRGVNSDSTRWSVGIGIAFAQQSALLAPPPSLISRCYNFDIYGGGRYHCRPYLENGKDWQISLGKAGQDQAENLAKAETNFPQDCAL